METEKLQSDVDGLEVASGLLKELQANGNFAAREYYLHMDRILSKIGSLTSRRKTRLAPQSESSVVADNQLVPISEPSFPVNFEFDMADDPLQNFLVDPSLQWELLDALTYP